MKINRRTLLRGSAAVVATLGMPALRAAESKIVLGQSAPFTGNAAQLGIQMNQGAKLWFDSVNANGGINGTQIELRSLDDGYEPERCKANTAQFIKDDVFALFGFVGTPTCLAALPQIVESKTPFFGPFTGAEALREPMHRNVFHVRASYYDETALIVNNLTSLGLNRIAVFHQNDAYGTAGLNGVKRALKAQNLEPVGTATVERNTVNVAAAVSTLVPLQPQAIVQISAYRSVAAFIREARKAGYGGQFYNVSFVGTQALADELKADGRGVMISQVMPFPHSPAQPVVREYLEAVKKAGGDHTANFSSIEGYIAARVFCEGLKRAGRNASREALINSLETINSMNLGGFNVSFGPKDRVASRYVDLSMLTGDGRVTR